MRLLTLILALGVSHVATNDGSLRMADVNHCTDCMNHCTNLLKWMELNGAQVTGVRVAYFPEHGWGLARSRPRAYSTAVPGYFAFPSTFILSAQTALVEQGPLPAVLGVDPHGIRDGTVDLEHIKVGCTNQDDDDFCVTFDGSEAVVAMYLALERAKGFDSFWYPYIDSIVPPSTPVYSLLMAALGGPARNVREWRQTGIGLEWVYGGMLAPGALVNLTESAQLIRKTFGPSSYASHALESAFHDELEKHQMQFAVLQRGGILESVMDQGGPRDSSFQPVDHELEMRRLLAWSNLVASSRGISSDIFNSGERSMGFALIPLWDMINHKRSTRHHNFGTYLAAENATRPYGNMISYYNPAQGPLEEDDGSEILNDYGFPAECALEWLLKFGFIPEDFLETITDSHSAEAGTGAAGCSDIVIGGQRHLVHAGTTGEFNVAELIRKAEAAWQESYTAGKGQLPALRLANVLLVRADELPADAFLRAQFDGTAIRLPKDHPYRTSDLRMARRNAAAVMLLERQALLGARAAILERLP